MASTNGSGPMTAMRRAPGVSRPDGLIIATTGGRDVRLQPQQAFGRRGRRTG